MNALRCAIYTRKSSEEGLEQGFNSLHAQREACEAYVLSQAGECWRALKTAYDDGGFSGGSMERPGLKALLADIAARRIDVVVVYKVDRLTRSLMDFAKIVELFDSHSVSFVSVTQAFNTTTSMGRLTLNVLLSFAQFEREVTGERIRDKIAASKKKGMWMGGAPPLGYDRPTDPLTRALVVNETEADIVRLIFKTYLELGSVHLLQRWLEDRGIKSKAWSTTRGRHVGGCSFERGALFHLLRNRTYIGEIVHKDATYPGAHLAIVDKDLFDAVQAKLEANVQRREGGGGRMAPMLLKGLIFDADGAPMSPTYTPRSATRVYRYYVSGELQKGRATGLDDDRLRRVSADLVEGLIKDCLVRLTARTVSEPKSLILRVEVHPTTVELRLTRSALFKREPDPDGELQIVRSKLAAVEGVRIDAWQPGEFRGNYPAGGAGGITGSKIPLEDEGGFVITLPCRLKRSGGRTWVADEQGRAVRTATELDLVLINALRSAHRLLVSEGVQIGFPEQIAIEAAPPNAYDRLVCRLAFLAPDIQQLILEGRQPAELTLAHLLANEIPPSWQEQRRKFLAAT